MSRAALVLAVLAVGAVAVGLAALLAGDGDAHDSASGVVWAEGPRVVTPPALPGDRVAYGQVRNDGPRAVTLAAGALRVQDGAGRPLHSTARFLPAYAPGGAGRVVTLAPGRTAPLTVAWRGAGARMATIGAVTLPLP